MSEPAYLTSLNAAIELQFNAKMMNKSILGHLRVTPHMLLAGLLCVAGLAGAQGDDLIEIEMVPSEAVSAPDQANFSEPEDNGERRLKVGMPLQEALELVGKRPDSEEEVGAACGMLDVHTWDEDGTRIISVDGTVTSIVKGGNGAR